MELREPFTENLAILEMARVINKKFEFFLLAYSSIQQRSKQPIFNRILDRSSGEEKRSFKFPTNRGEEWQLSSVRTELAR